MPYPFNGITFGLDQLFRLSDAKSRSISPENRTGGKGMGAMCELADGTARSCARDLGKGWKVNPHLPIRPGETLVLGEIEGPGCIQHIWLTPPANGAARFSAFTGTARKPPLSNARWGTFSPPDGSSMPRFPRCRSASTPGGPSIATGRCLSANPAASRWKTAVRNR